MNTTDNQNEQFIVVDPMDSVVTFKSRYECHHNRDLIHRAVNIALYNKAGKIAFQKRSKTKDLYPSFFTLSATGHVSKGETYETTAQRELYEEMGVKNISLLFVKTHLVEAPHEREMVALFKGTYEGPFKFFKDEVEEVCWFGKDDLPKILKKITPCSLASLKILGQI